MTYHGDCCVCVLTLLLCAFGSMTTSTGVCLFLNYEVFGGNSTTTRTLPGGDWTRTAGIAIGAVGIVMCTSGLFLAIFCLTAGVSDKKNSIDKYEVFHNENEEDVEEKSGTSNTGARPSVTPPTTGVVSTVHFPTSHISNIPVIDCAYDVAFSVEQEAKFGQISRETSIQEHALGEQPDSSACKPCDITEDKDDTNQAQDCISSPRVEYPSVNLQETDIYIDYQDDMSMLF